LGSAAEARTEAGEVGPMVGGWPAARVVGIHGKILAGGAEVAAGGGGWPATQEVGLRGGSQDGGEGVGSVGGAWPAALGWGGRRRGEVRAGRRRCELGRRGVRSWGMGHSVLSGAWS
jgi:hypothetical protein